MLFDHIKTVNYCWIISEEIALSAVNFNVIIRCFKSKMLDNLCCIDVHITDLKKEWRVNSTFNMTSVLVNILPKITVEPLSSPMVTNSQEYAGGKNGK